MSERSFDKGIARDDLPQNPPPVPERARVVLRIEDVQSPEHLRMLSGASGGFVFVADENLARESLRTGVLKTGFTRMDTREIHYNPLLLRGEPKLKIEPWTAADIKGFTYHEAGHHAPEVLQLALTLLHDLASPAMQERIPEGYRGDPKAEARFFQSIHAHLHNALLDIWLESYMGRRPYYVVRESITEFQAGKGENKTYRDLTKPEQLIQILLRSRYLEQKGVAEKVDPDVHESFTHIMESRVMGTMLDRDAFEDPFPTLADQERAIERKAAAYSAVFLPEFLKLMDAELTKRKQEKQQEKREGKQEEGEQEGPEGAGRSPSGAVPLTKEEEQQLVEEILRALEAAAEKEHHAEAPSEEEEQEHRRAFQEIEARLQAAHEGKEVPSPEEPKKPHGVEAIRSLQEAFEREARERRRKALAESMHVRQESIQRWERIKGKYHLEIASTAAALAEVFLDDRRKRIEFLQRQGEIVPGLEFETIAAVISGQLDPETKMREVQNPEFLETELEFIVDTSGSMGGEKIEKSIELMVIIVEAFKRVRESLADENLLHPNEEQPFRVGATKFADTPERITRTKEPLDDQKELRIVDKASMIGGGTEETGALMEVYGELTLNKNNVIKIIIVLTDGHGNREGVARILWQVEDDDEVIFLAVGLGDEAEGIVDTYCAPFLSREQNIFGHPAKNPADALPAVLDFLKREVAKRQRTYT